VQIRLKIPAAADPSAFGSKDDDTDDSLAIVKTLGKCSGGKIHLAYLHSLKSLPDDTA
jgi:hypothetical protein